MGKKVRVEGFEFTNANNISTDDIYVMMKARLDGDTKIGKSEHAAFVDNYKGYIAGLILTYKGNKTFLESKKDTKGNLMVQKHELGDGEAGIEPSVFVIKPSINKGLIIRHQGSISGYHFEMLLRTHHNNVKNEYVKAAFTEEQQLKPDESKNYYKKIRKKILNHYKGKFDFTFISSQKDIESALKAFHKIDSISSSVTQDIGTKTPMFSPIVGELKKLMCKVTFENKILTRNVKTNILKVFNRENFSSLKGIRLIGQSYNSEKILAIVGENRDYYDKIDYDDYVEMLPDALWKDFSSTLSIKYLINLMEMTPAVFG